MEPAFIQGLSILITIAGTVFAVSNHVSSRFNKLTTDISNLVTETAVEATEIKRDIERIKERMDDSLEYKINANKELINHRTARFESSVDHADALNRERVESLRLQLNESRDIVLAKLNLLQVQISEMQQFLAKTSEFTIRD